MRRYSVMKQCESTRSPVEASGNCSETSSNVSYPVAKKYPLNPSRSLLKLLRSRHSNGAFNLTETKKNGGREGSQKWRNVSKFKKKHHRANSYGDILNCNSRPLLASSMAAAAMCANRRNMKPLSPSSSFQNFFLASAQSVYSSNSNDSTNLPSVQQSPGSPDKFCCTMLNLTRKSKRKTDSTGNNSDDNTPNCLSEPTEYNQSSFISKDIHCYESLIIKTSSSTIQIAEQLEKHLLTGLQPKAINNGLLSGTVMMATHVGRTPANSTANWGANLSTTHQTKLEQSSSLANMQSDAIRPSTSAALIASAKECKSAMQNSLSGCLPISNHQRSSSAQPLRRQLSIKKEFLDLMNDWEIGGTQNPWVCPSDRHLQLRAQLKSGWSVRTASARSPTNARQQNCSTSSGSGASAAASGSNLSEAEQEHIRKVLARADRGRRNEELRICKMMDRLEKLRSRATGNGVTQCLLCQTEFGLLASKSYAAMCLNCRKYVCQRNCGVETFDQKRGEPIFLCKICSEYREVMWKKSGAWFYREMPNIRRASLTDVGDNPISSSSAAILCNGGISTPTCGSYNGRRSRDGEYGSPNSGTCSPIEHQSVSSLQSGYHRNQNDFSPSHRYTNNVHNTTNAFGSMSLYRNSGQSDVDPMNSAYFPLYNPTAQSQHSNQSTTSRQLPIPPNQQQRLKTQPRPRITPSWVHEKVQSSISVGSDCEDECEDEDEDDKDECPDVMPTHASPSSSSSSMSRTTEFLPQQQQQHQQQRLQQQHHQHKITQDSQQQLSAGRPVQQHQLQQGGNYHKNSTSSLLSGSGSTSGRSRHHHHHSNYRPKDLPNEFQEGTGKNPMIDALSFNNNDHRRTKKEYHQHYRVNSRGQITDTEESDNDESRRTTPSTSPRHSIATPSSYGGDDISSSQALIPNDRSLLATNSFSNTSDAFDAKSIDSGVVQSDHSMQQAQIATDSFAGRGGVNSCDGNANVPSIANIVGNNYYLANKQQQHLQQGHKQQQQDATKLVQQSSSSSSSPIPPPIPPRSTTIGVSSFLRNTPSITPENRRNSANAPGMTGTSTTTGTSDSASNLSLKNLGTNTVSKMSHESLQSANNFRNSTNVQPSSRNNNSSSRPDSTHSSSDFLAMSISGECIASAIESGRRGMFLSSQFSTHSTVSEGSESVGTGSITGGVGNDRASVTIASQDALKRGESPAFMSSPEDSSKKLSNKYEKTKESRKKQRNAPSKALSTEATKNDIVPDKSKSNNEKIRVGKALSWQFPFKSNQNENSSMGENLQCKNSLVEKQSKRKVGKQQLCFLNTPPTLTSAMRHSPSPTPVSPASPLSYIISPSFVLPINNGETSKSVNNNCLRRPALVRPALSIESDDGEIRRVEDFDALDEFGGLITPKLKFYCASPSPIPIGDKSDNLSNGSGVESCDDEVGSDITGFSSQASDGRESAPISEGRATSLTNKSIEATNANSNEEEENDTLGSIQFNLTYLPEEQQLIIHLIQAKNLKAMDKNGFSDPYVKFHLIPGNAKATKLTSKTIEKTLNPEWHEELIYYGITEDDRQRKSLRVSVLDRDRIGSDFLGETRVALKKLTLGATKKFNLYLENAMPTPIEKTEELERGKILVSICYNIQQGSLFVNIKRCAELLGMDSTGFSDPYCKVSLTPLTSKAHRQKTSIKKRSLNPEFNSLLQFIVPFKDLPKKTLEIGVYDYDVGRHDDYIGGILLSTTAKDLRGKQWRECIQNPGKTYEYWHKLELDT